MGFGLGGSGALRKEFGVKMNQHDLIQKFQTALPAMRKWIEQTLKENKPNGVSVSSLSFSRLSTVFPPDLLDRAKAVVVTGRVPFPPLSRMGLPEFKQMENMPAAGITYKDTYFLTHFDQSESLHFHELVHVIQWERLGVDNFLLAYGAGLVQFGYEDSPLEKTAYSLQTEFDRGFLTMNTVEIIRKRTDAVWNEVSCLLSKA